MNGPNPEECISDYIIPFCHPINCKTLNYSFLLTYTHTRNFLEYWTNLKETFESTFYTNL